MSTDWKPVAEIEFTKERGKDRKDNETILLEDFISIKGLSALGNQLTKDKVKQINLLEPIPVEEVIEETSENSEDSDESQDDEQPTLF